MDCANQEKRKQTVPATAINQLERAVRQIINAVRISVMETQEHANQQQPAQTTIKMDMETREAQHAQQVQHYLIAMTQTHL